MTEEANSRFIGFEKRLTRDSFVTKIFLTIMEARAWLKNDPDNRCIKRFGEHVVTPGDHTIDPEDDELEGPVYDIVDGTPEYRWLVLVPDERPLTPMCPYSVSSHKVSEAFQEPDHADIHADRLLESGLSDRAVIVEVKNAAYYTRNTDD
jgi:hypothetical protein